MIRNIVIHLMNEQPLLADLFGLPSAGDAGMLCTNLRTLDGKRPVFIDHSDSTFFFPYLHIRFLEWTASADDGTGPSAPSTASGAGALPPAARAPDARLEDGSMPVYPTPPPGSLLPVVMGADGDGTGSDEIAIDEDFLRRIREV